MKKLVFVWTLDVCNYKQTTYDNFWGLGDIVRGMIATADICAHEGYDFIVDTTKHPIHKYLVQSDHDVEIDYTNIPFIPCSHKDQPEKQEIISFVKNNTSQSIAFMTNSFPLCKDDISSNIKNRIKHVFTFTDEVHKKIKQIMNDLTLPINYNTLHFRLGDGHMVESERNIKLPENILNIINKHDLNNTLILSDSQLLKDNIRKHLPRVKMYNTNNIAHVGKVDHTANMLDTVLEFILATSSQKITSYSTYEWPSGFVNTCKILYDTRVDNYKI